ncbi:MAG: solute:sodium symporter family transporter [Alkalibacterium gilvum]|uniref:solute:sodium symporter family transporter n=1 Tax=Alkalibacterium gilvum TaxID=1130080 RepID=UPI002356F678
MSVMGWEVISGVVLVLVATLLLPRYLRQGITTIPDFIEARFDKGTKQFVTLLFLVSYVVNMLPITLYSGAVAMSQIFSIEEIFGITYAQGIWVMVWVIGIVGAIYAIFGGLKAVAVSDSINGVALVVGGLLVPLFSILYIGSGNFMEGLSTFVAATPEKFNAIGSSTDDLPFTTLFTGLLLVNLYYWGTDQSIIQRGLGAKSLEEGQKGIIYAGFLKVGTPFLVIIPGIMGYQILGGDISNADMIYPELVSTVLPGPLVGFFAAAMMGAILSTFNSVLNSASTLFALNVYKPISSKDLPDSELVKKGKIFGTIVAVLSMIGARFIMYAPQGLFDYLQTINGFFNVPIFTIVFMGYLTKRVPPFAAKIGITFFVTTYEITQLFWDTGLHFLHISAILFVITSLGMYIIGKIKPMEEPFIIEDKELVDIKPWKNLYRGGGFVIFVMISMYVVFSPLGLAKEGGMNSVTLISIILVGVVCAIGSLLLEKFNLERTK